MIDEELKKIKNISVVDLEKDVFFEKIDKLTNKYYEENYIGDASELWYFLDQLISESSSINNDNSYILQKYQLILDKLAWISFSFLPSLEMGKLFKTKLIFGVNLEINVIEEIKSLFSLYTSSRKRIRKNLLNNIKENIESVGSDELKISSEDNRFIPTVKNWLIDYDRFSVIEKRKDRMAILDYINSNENVKNLSKDQRLVLRSVLELYDFLRFFDITTDLLKNKYQSSAKALPHSKQKDNKLHSNKKVFKPKEVTSENIKDSSPKEDKKIIEVLLESYQAFELDLKNIDSFIKDCEKYQNNPDGLFKKFNQDLLAEDRDNLLAALVFVCQNKLLDKFLQENKELLTEFKKYLSFKLSDDVIKSIIKKSTSPETVSLYLQFLLFKKIKLSSKNAGLFGMHLANIFKRTDQEKYFPIVYGDLNLEQFVWREVIEENGLVKFK
jgi:hypothetical protein